MNPLAQFTDEQLQAECDRRIKEKYEAERKQREVKVVCPSCNGVGRIHHDSFEGTTCTTCKGQRIIIAQRA